MPKALHMDINADNIEQWSMVCYFDRVGGDWVLELSEGKNVVTFRGPYWALEFLEQGMDYVLGKALLTEESIEEDLVSLKEKLFQDSLDKHGSVT